MKILMAIVLFVFTLSLQSAPRPFLKHENAKFTQVDQTTMALEATTEELISSKVAYSKARHTFSSTAAAASTFEIGDAIPAGAIIFQAFVRVPTVIVSANDNTISFSCNGQELMPAADLTDASAGYLDAAAFVLNLPVRMTAECTPIGTVGAGASGITAGAIELYLMYIEAI
jgi:hypothetical protein